MSGIAAAASGDRAAGAGNRPRVFAAVCGNMLEVFDFIAYGTYAVAIGHAFFPAKSDFLSLLLSVSTFGIGFVTRPLGALLIGLLADRRGRRAGMSVSLGLMGLGSLMIAVLPPYAVLGPAAPLLLVLARLIQGIAWGGEAGPVTAYLLESAPPGRRGAFGAWQATSQSLAVLLSGAIGLVLTALVGAGAMAGWGWRVPFALGVLLVPLGLWLRSRMEEPGEAAATALPGERASSAAAEAWRARWLLFCGFLTLVAGTVSQYFLNYATSFALTVLHLPQAEALWPTVAAGVAGAAGAWWFGRLSDRFGSVPAMAVPRALLAVLIVPLLLLAMRRPDPLLFTVIVALVALLQVGGFAASVVALADALPARMRSTGFGLIYAVAISLFGGTAQTVFALLQHAAVGPVAIGWYLALVNAVAVPAAIGLGRRRAG
ncbi:MFS transporter [Rhizosaccharibacter radicis]|uniref:MFS transporter n=1 Tax=Rhizosaccharibacter radicis TaxID=2782605 RepID=A0ABT1VVW8_9PROT|nr:MFS transporter [Acetobacteraceae bacterium KSS12]